MRLTICMNLANKHFPTNAKPKSMFNQFSNVLQYSNNLYFN